jgi:hypothetical protein
MGIIKINYSPLCTISKATEGMGVMDSKVHIPGDITTRMETIMAKARIMEIKGVIPTIDMAPMVREGTIMEQNLTAVGVMSVWPVWEPCVVAV